MSFSETLQAMLETKVAESPNDIAAVFTNQSITYYELNKRVNQFAYHLRQMGIKADSHVAICMKRSIDLLIAIFGILKAGGAYVPLDLSYPEERLLFILKDCNPELLILQSGQEEKFSRYQVKLLVLEKDIHLINKLPIENPLPVSASHNLAYVIYTSGSTGMPKGVLIEHRSVINYCSWFAKYSTCQAQQRIDFSSNYIFDMAITSLIVPMVLGLTVIICNEEIKNNLRDYIKYLVDHHINIVKMTPSYFKVLLHELKSLSIDLPHLKNIILGGENLCAADCASWLTIYPNHHLFNEYGPTEATVAVTEFKVSSNNVFSLTANVPIGKAGPNMECYILDVDNHPVKVGQIGELHIGGKCLARGYLNRPELARKAFIDNPFKKGTRLYKTGDLCRQFPDNTIEYIGRIDDQVKIRGFRIEPGEVEKYLSKHPLIEEVVVLAREYRENEKRLIAYYIFKNAQQNALTPNELRQYLQTYLPDHMIPSAFVRIDNLPLNANGKLDRFALPIPRFTTGQHFLPPRTLIERSLAEIWSEELEIKPIGLEDDFFELGGHSLSAARITSQINKTFGVNINLRDFYTLPTIKNLVVLINKENKNDNYFIVTKNKNYEDKARMPLSDFQFLLWASITYDPTVKNLNIVARKRIKARLAADSLTLAFAAMIKKHEVLRYHICKYRPVQFVANKLPFSFTEKNLEGLSKKDAESILTTSANELALNKAWPKKKPLLIARLFHLEDEIDELQLCIPHLIGDDTFNEIFFNDLSFFYLQHQYQTETENRQTDKLYQNYLFQEHDYIDKHLDKDIAFWTDYLKDTIFLKFPPENVIRRMESQPFGYSTYQPIPENTLNNLQQFCAERRVSIHDGLCAALSLSLSKFSTSRYSGQPFFITISRSTRDNHSYDDTIGCFLRLEPIKVTVNSKTTFAKLAKQIHRSTIQTMPYQRTSSIIKISCISVYRTHKKWFRRALVNLFAPLYTLLIRNPRLNSSIIKLAADVHSLDGTNMFNIGINVRSDFISANKKKLNNELFATETYNVNQEQPDILKTNHFLDTCFLRDEISQTPYIVISSNLKPEFRLAIANEVIRILSFETGNE